MSSVDVTVVSKVLAPKLANLGLVASREGVLAGVSLEGILATSLLTVQDNVLVVDNALVERDGRGKLHSGQLSGGDTNVDGDSAVVEEGAVLGESRSSDASTRLGRDGSTSREELNIGARVPSRGGGDLDHATTASRAAHLRDSDSGRNATNAGRLEGTEVNNVGTSVEDVGVSGVGDVDSDGTSTISSNNLPADGIVSSDDQRVGSSGGSSTTTARSRLGRSIIPRSWGTQNSVAERSADKREENDNRKSSLHFPQK